MLARSSTASVEKDDAKPTMDDAGEGAVARLFRAASGLLGASTAAHAVDGAAAEAAGCPDTAAGDKRRRRHRLGPTWRFACCNCEFRTASEQKAVEHQAEHVQACTWASLWPRGGDHVYRWDGLSPTKLTMHHGIIVPWPDELCGVRVLHFAHDRHLNVLQPDPTAVLRIETVLEFLAGSASAQEQLEQPQKQSLERGEALKDASMACKSVVRSAPSVPQRSRVGIIDPLGARRDHPLYAVPYARSEALPRKEVLARALRVVRKTGYHPLTCNSEHVSRWCKTGRFQSSQVVGFMGGACSVALGAHAAGFMLGGLPGMLAASAVVKTTKVTVGAYAGGQNMDSLKSEASRSVRSVGLAAAREPLPAAEATCCSCGADANTLGGLILASSGCDHASCYTCARMIVRSARGLARSAPPMPVAVWRSDMALHTKAEIGSALTAWHAWRARRRAPPWCPVRDCWHQWDLAAAAVRQRPSPPLRAPEADDECSLSSGETSREV